MLRHRYVELCPVGALALLFFTHFHVLQNPAPNFVPDFTDPKSGEYGRRDWYSFHVFYAKEPKDEMSYSSKSVSHRVLL